LNVEGKILAVDVKTLREARRISSPILFFGTETARRVERAGGNLVEFPEDDRKI
jgi:hypothetical protein